MAERVRVREITNDEGTWTAQVQDQPPRRRSATTDPACRRQEAGLHDWKPASDLQLLGGRYWVRTYCPPGDVTGGDLQKGPLTCTYPNLYRPTLVDARGHD
jgi:hypothetical protein